MTAIQIIAGLVLLLAGGDFVVRGAVALASRLGVSALVIGLTIVGFGTSLPELLVSLKAALSGSPGIAVGNVVGSNIANTMLILGCAAMVFPIMVHPAAVRRDTTSMVIVTVIFIAFGLTGEVGRLEGAAMVAMLCGYIIYSLWRDMRTDDATASLHREEAEELADGPRALWLVLLFIGGGLVGVALGAEFLVHGATALARAAGVGEEVIGLTLVAVGTSLPELATSLMAAWRRHADVCLGNVLGSNIFNLFGILGITAVVIPVPFADKIVAFDLWVLLAVSLLIAPIMISGWRISRVEGSVLLILYAAYIVSQFWGLSGFGKALTGEI